MSVHLLFSEQGYRSGPESDNAETTVSPGGSREEEREGKRKSESKDERWRESERVREGRGERKEVIAR